MTANLADLVRASAERTPDRAALLFHSSVLTWTELDAQVDAVGHALRSHGLLPGDRIGLHLTNTPDFAACWFGALRAGLVAVPLNPGLTAQELRRELTDSGARALVTRPSFTATAQALLAQVPGLELLVVTGAGPVPPGGRTLAQLREDGAAGGRLLPTTGDEDLAALLYTSGTSGSPKGAMLSHRALLANLESGAAIEPPVVTADDVVLLVLPLFHVYGLNAGLGAVAFHGATGLLVERFDPSGTLELVQRHEVTTLLGAPPMYHAWSVMPGVGAALSAVRVAISGAAPLPAEVLERLRESTGHHVFEGYGLTETAPVLSSTLMSAAATPESIGRALPGVELRLVDVDGSPAGEGDPGEIHARGANLFSGYWPDGRDGPDDDGWWPTGDVAYLDEEGDLHLVDRRRELILVSGFNVYPREVEQVLATAPGVGEAAVIGVPHPYTGESVKALVVPAPGATVSTEDVLEHCSRSLARFKCPTSVEIVDELPHSATGKVSKGRLRAALETQGAAPS